MSNTRGLIKNIAAKLKSEQKDLKIIESRIKMEKAEIKNKNFFRLLLKADKINKRISLLQLQLQTLTKNYRRQIIVNVGSKVQLISARIGEVLFVDAKSYFQLIGKGIGDMVVMNNAIFYIAGVY